eukprot:585264-Alexandrium_andersonii.AAC.1
MCPLVGDRFFPTFRIDRNAHKCSPGAPLSLLLSPGLPLDSESLTSPHPAAAVGFRAACPPSAG